MLRLVGALIGVAAMAAGGWLKAGVGAHKVFKWWRRNEIGKLILGKETTEETSERLQYEVTEVKGMALRTSTGAGLAGVAVNLLMQVLQAFPQTAELATPEVAAGLTAVVMWVVARVWKTPEKPGAI